MSHRASFVAGLGAGVALTALALSAPGLVAARAEAGQAAAQAKGAANIRVLLENDRVRVREAIFPAGVTRTGEHTHEYAHVGVLLTPGELVFTEGGKSETVKFTVGQVGFREAKATHDVGNPGKQDMRVIEVELKK